MIFEYLVINVTPASSVKVLTQELNAKAQRGWVLQHQQYIEMITIQFTFEREYNAERTAMENMLDEDAKQKKIADADTERKLVNELLDKKYAGLAGKT